MIHNPTMSPENKLFSNVKYVLTGEVKEEVKLLLQCSSAESCIYFSDYVTHCIVGENFCEIDIEDAVGIYEIPAVMQEWVTYSHKCNKLLPSAFKGGCNQLFTGVAAIFSKVIQEDKKKLWAMLKYYGGTFSSVIKETNTHLIITKAEGSMYQQAMKSPGKICVVTPDWLVDSVRAGHLVDTELYHPRLLLEKTTSISGDQPQVLLQKNMQPQVVLNPEEIRIWSNNQTTKCSYNSNSTIPMEHGSTQTALNNGGEKENSPNLSQSSTTSPSSLSQSSGGSPWLGWEYSEGSPFNGWDNPGSFPWDEPNVCWASEELKSPFGNPEPYQRPQAKVYSESCIPAKKRCRIMNQDHQEKRKKGSF